MEPQDTIKPDEVVDMSVGYKDIAYLQDISGREVAGVPGIKENRSSLSKQSHVKTGVLERGVEKPRMKCWFH